MDEYRSKRQPEDHPTAPPTTENELQQRERRAQDNLSLLRPYFDLLHTEDLDAVLELLTTPSNGSSCQRAT